MRNFSEKKKTSRHLRNSTPIQKGGKGEQIGPYPNCDHHQVDFVSCKCFLVIAASYDRIISKQTNNSTLAEGT